MEKDVIISIKGTQKYDGGEPGAVELVTAGRLAQDEAGYTLSYQESEPVPIFLMPSSSWTVCFG